MQLSERQARMHRFLKSYVSANGYPPSIREIGRGLGISSTSVVRYNLVKLETAGLLRRTPGLSRAIRVEACANKLPRGARGE